MSDEELSSLLASETIIHTHIEVVLLWTYGELELPLRPE